MAEQKRLLASFLELKHKGSCPPSTFLLLSARGDPTEQKAYVGLAGSAST